MTSVAASDVVTISGVTEINSSSRYQYDAQIKTVYVCRGVKSINDFAFDGCSNLSRVEISDTVTKIGSYAFDDTKISRIGIPKSVTTIDETSFDSSRFSDYSTSPNKNMVIYCEPGSAAEAYAQQYNLKYVYATMVYAADGRTMMVTDAEKAGCLSVGWYAQPVSKIYALGGKTAVVPTAQVAAYQKVGWYTEPVIKMYAADGRTAIVRQSQVAASQKVGWYTEPVVKMYAADGRTALVRQSQVAANQKVGWYTVPVTKMYARDGRTAVVPTAQVGAHQKVGWYLIGDYALVKADQDVRNSGYSAAVRGLEKYLNPSDASYVNDYSARVKILGKKTALLASWYASIKCPLAVVGWSRTVNSIGIPVIHITYRNVSTKTITGFGDQFTCYDAYGNATSDYPSLYSDSATYKSKMSGDSILPGEEVVYYSTLYNHESTTSISWPYVLNITFSDGTTWSR